jgi:sterol desaturase/sphingolipid hydroxylase (fatty acid hydroxylase superfamily)
MNRRICTVDRDELRRWIPKRYSPALHLAGMYGTGLAAIVWLAATYLTAIRFTHLLAMPCIFAAASLVEYAAHRWLMHTRRSWLPLAWDAHVGRHHHYYRADAPTWDHARDVWLILFSPLDVLILCALLVGPFALLRFAVSAGSWALVLVTCIVYFLVYEALHLAFHLPDSHWVSRVEPLASLRARHVRHHELADTHANYSVIIPLWDRMFGTARK